MNIDSHQHFWNYHANPADFPWMDDDCAVLRRDFLPADLVPWISDHGFDGTIAVQAREMEVETSFLLDLADQNPWILGVVGWLDLLDPSVEERIERFAARPRLKGLRMLIHDQPDRWFAISPGHVRGVSLLERYGLAYDLLLKPPHLEPATRLVDRFPNQRFVVDHLAKPAIATETHSPWREDLRELARRPNVFCKVSGMVTQAGPGPWSPACFEPYLSVVLEAFGPDRIMIGSDWPVCTCAADYRTTMQAAIDWAAALSPAERSGFLGGNCASFYRL